MPTPLSRRATTGVFLGVAVAVAVILLAFVWPGFLVVQHCAQSSGPFASVNGRTYCAAAVPVPFSTTHYYGNHTEWGFAFYLYAPPTPGFRELAISITEPNGTTFSGGMSIGGPVTANLTARWFTPDNESGVAVVWNAQNASLLVQR